MLEMNLQTIDIEVMCYFTKTFNNGILYKIHDKKKLKNVTRIHIIGI